MGRTFLIYSGIFLCRIYFLDLIYQYNIIQKVFLVQSIDSVNYSIVQFYPLFIPHFLDCTSYNIFPDFFQFFICIIQIGIYFLIF